MKITSHTYKKWVVDLKEKINISKLHTSLQVNSNMLILYWYLGKEVNQKIEIESWGSNVIEKLSIDLQKSFPNVKGFSVRSIEYMQQFYNAYPNLLIPQQAVAEIGSERYIFENPLLLSIPWGHHLLLLQKIETFEERMWYIQKTIENNWSRAVLQYQMDTDLYTRQYKTKKASNFHLTLPKLQSDLANQILKDPYQFDFLQISEKTTELELEKKLVHHIQEFLLELGAGFAFMGRQVKIKIGRKERFLDLFFYHVFLKCFVVIELKLEDFEPEFVGQMNTYLNVINKEYKQETDNPSIGIILCSSKDNVEVEFALQNINHPIGVSDYKFIKNLPKGIRDKMPTAKQLQDEVKRFLKSRRTSVGTEGQTKKK
jgi:predicted nuclease of restriction endonuclease-like (RecB) superfamily